MVDRAERRRRELITQLIFIAVLVIGALALFYFIGAFEKPVSSTHTVQFKVFGSSGMAVVSHSVKGGGTTGPMDVSLPFTSSRIEFPTSVTVVVTAGDPTGMGGLTCQILLDGQVWREDSVDSPDDRLACAGTITR